MNTLIRELFHIGTKDPYRLVDILNLTDPFHVKLDNISNFECDPSMRMPRYIDEIKLQDFRNNTPGTYIFYQHIRKAGGTEFCDQVKRNVPVKEAPIGDCQYYWIGAIASNHFKYNVSFREYMTSHNYHVAFNEWDVFFEYFFDWPGAVFVTEFRDPLERWYSQYRFEHLEYHAFPPARRHRFGTAREPFMYWYATWPKKTMGLNYYVKTFIGENIPESYAQQHGRLSGSIPNWYWTYWYYKDAEITIEMFERALRNLSKFSLILILEWINDPATVKLMTQLFGWKNGPKNVIPNANEYHMNRSFVNPLIESVREDEYRYIAMENVFDMLFYHIARRMFLEQLMCPNLSLAW